MMMMASATRPWETTTDNHEEEEQSQTGTYGDEGVRLPYSENSHGLSHSEGTHGKVPADCPGADALYGSQRVYVDSLDTSTEVAKIRPCDMPLAEPKEVPFADLSALTRPMKMRERKRADDGLRAGSPKYYQPQNEASEQIIDACPIDVYCSSSQATWGWPFKLQPYYRPSGKVSNSAETVIVDSGFNRWGSPRDVFEAAAKVDADYVIATDVTGMESPYTCPVSYCSAEFDTEEEVRRHITRAGNRHEGLNGSDLPDDLADNLATRGHNFDMPTTDDPGINSHMDAAMEGIRRFMEMAREWNVTERVILPLQPPYEAFLERVDEAGWLDEVGYVAVGGMLTIPDVN